MSGPPGAADAAEAPRWARAPATLIGALCLVVYGPALAAGYVWDDVLLLEALPPPGGGLLAAAGLDLADAGLRAGEGGAGYFRPLLLLGLAAERAAGPLAPALGHLHNLAWQLLALVGLDRWAARRGLGPAARAVALAIFGLHPLQVEPVVWISARSDLMMSAAALWALALAPARGVAAGLAQVALGLFAALAKDPGALLPLALLLEGGPRPALRAALGVGLAGAARALAGVGAPPVALEAAVAVLPTLAQISARDVLLPLGLHPGEHLGWSPPPPRAPLLALGALLLLLIGAGRGAARAGIALALGAWLPATVAVGALGLVGLRYHHLALAGLGLAAGAAADRWLRPGPTRGVAAALALGLAAAGAAQLPGWASDAPFWEAAVARHPNPYTWAGRGVDRWSRGELDGAAADLIAATAAPKPIAVACGALGPLLIERGALDVAAREGQRALAAGCPAEPTLLGATAAALVGVGALPEAAALAARMPDDPRAYGLLVRVAVEADRGEFTALDGAPAAARGPIAGQAAALLEAGGRGAAAAALRARSGP